MKAPRPNSDSIVPLAWYGFEGVACTQWARHAGLHGTRVRLVTAADTEAEARLAFHRCLLRPLQEPSDSDVRIVGTLGDADEAERGLVYVDGAVPSEDPQWMLATLHGVGHTALNNLR